jgi:hypothetical protein
MRRGLRAKLQAMWLAPRPVELAFVGLVLVAVFLYLPVSLTFGRGLARPVLDEPVPLGLPALPFRTDDIDAKGFLSVPAVADAQASAEYNPSGRNIFAFGTPPPPPPTPTPTGACCSGPSTDKDCTILTEEQCRGSSGRYKGNGSLCRAGTCEPPPPPPPPPPPTPPIWDPPVVKLFGFLRSPSYPIPCLKDEKENIYVALLGDIVEIKPEGQPAKKIKITKINLDSIDIANPENTSQVQTLKLVAQ